MHRLINTIQKRQDFGIHLMKHCLISLGKEILLKIYMDDYQNSIKDLSLPYFGCLNRSNLNQLQFSISNPKVFIEHKYTIVCGFFS